MQKLFVVTTLSHVSFRVFRDNFEISFTLMNHILIKFVIKPFYEYVCLSAAMVMLGRSVHLTILNSWTGLTKPLYNLYFVDIRLLVTDNIPS